jgi:transposase
MTIAHSEEFRKKAIDMIESGKSVREVADMLNIGRASIYLWKRQQSKCGSFAPKSYWQKGYHHKIANLDAFKQFVSENKGLTASDLAKKWGNISIKTMCKWLHRIDFEFSRKNKGNFDKSV